MSDTRTKFQRLIPLIAFCVALVVVPTLYFAHVIGIELVNQLGRYLCFAIVALGVDLVWGYTGVLSLCQAMFFCFGAYAMGMHLALHGPMDGNNSDIPRCLFVVSSDVSGFKLPWFWEPFHWLPAAVILGMAIPGIAAFLFGYVAFRSRVRGVYFSIITQATTLAAWNIFCLNNMRLCGTNGLTNFVTLAGVDLREWQGKLTMYFTTVIVLALVYQGCRHLVNSRAGRILIAIRDNETRLRFSGYQPLFFKVFVFTVAAAIAGIGGMLYSPQMGIVTPSNMEVDKSILIVVFVAVGGRGTLAGAVIGALAVNLVYSVMTTQFPAYWPFTLAALALGVVLYFPSGLIGMWRRTVGGGDEEHAAPTPGKRGAKPLAPPALTHEEAQA